MSNVTNARGRHQLDQLVHLSFLSNSKSVAVMSRNRIGLFFVSLFVCFFICLVKPDVDMIDRFAIFCEIE